MLKWLCEPYVGKERAFAKSLFMFFTNYEFRVNARVRRVLYSSGLRSLHLARKLQSKHHITFAETVTAGDNLRLVHPFGVVIGAGAIFGQNVSIYQNVTIGQNRSGFPTIGDNVIIYANSVIVGDISIGDNAIIGAGSVVVKDVPENAIVGGVPARIIRYRDQSSDSALY